MTDIIDIVSLDNVQFTKFQPHYQSKLVNKIKDSFTLEEQQIFLTSFYCYLNCDKDAYVIDLTKVQAWCGYTRYDNAKTVLEKVENADYKIFAPVGAGAIDSCLSSNRTGKAKRGGHNKEQILMTLDTFKRFCVKAGKKAAILHIYYIKLEAIIFKLMEEQSEDLTNQLKIKDSVIEQNEETLQKEKERILVRQNPVNTQCIYYGYIDDTNAKNERLIKFGLSNNIGQRLESHKSTYTNFRLQQVYKVTNNIAIENIIKSHPVLSPRKRIINIRGKPKVEIMSIDMEPEFEEIIAICDEQTIKEFEEVEGAKKYPRGGKRKDSRGSRAKPPVQFNIDTVIKEIIREAEYNPDNYHSTLEENEKLKLENTKKDKLIKQLEKDIKLKDKKLGVFKENKKNKTVTITDGTGNFIMYAFRIGQFRYKCGTIEVAKSKEISESLKEKFPDGEMEYVVRMSNKFTYKIAEHFMRRDLDTLKLQCFDGSIGDIKEIMDTCVLLERVFHRNDMNTVFNNLTNFHELSEPREQVNVPTSRRSPRPVNQIDPDTNVIINTFDTFEDSGSAVGCTGAAISSAVRNGTVTKGFAWRYANVSREDQYSDQPVIKVNCTTGEKTHFDTISAAKTDAGISSPGLRMRILTQLHVDGFHWIFDKDSGRYL